MTGPEEHLGLSSLLEEDLTSYEYYQSLDPSLQRELEVADVGSFEEMQATVTRLKNLDVGTGRDRLS